MTINNRVCLVPALDGFRVTPTGVQSYYGTTAFGAVAGGPAGSASMTFFAVAYPYQLASGIGVLFGRYTGAAGWSLYLTTNQFAANAWNSTPALVQALSGNVLTALEGLRVPYLLIGSYQNGTLTLWVNGVLMGTTALGAGFTPYVGPTIIGAQSNAGNNSAASSVADCGFLDTYDPTAFVSALYGNGVAGLSAMWLEDLREGRYLTWPRVAAVSSDWYWASRDVVAGFGVKPTWTDRYTAQVLTRFGSPQGASFPARPA